MVESEIKKRNREDHWDLYLVLYSKMTEETFISFEEFFGEDFNRYSEMSEEEIRAEFAPIIENHEKR